MMYPTWGSDDKQPPKLPLLQVTAHDLDVEQAEGEVLRSIEERHGLSRRSPISPHGASGWGAGEAHGKESPSTSAAGSPGVVQWRISRLEAAVRAQQAASGHASILLQDMIEEEETGVGTYRMYLSPRTRAEDDGLMKAAAAAYQNTTTPQNPYGSHYDHHFLKGQDTNYTSVDENEHRVGLFQRAKFGRGLLGGGSPPGKSNTPLPRQQGDTSHSTSDYIATTKEGFVYPRSPRTRKSLHATGRSHYSYPHNVHHGKHKKKHVFPRWAREIFAMFHPYRVFNNCLDILVLSQFLWVGVPSLIGSAMCFYLLGNPTLHLLPGEFTIAVWLLFVTRQTVTLGFARLTVFIVIDGLMLGTHLAVQTLGPLLTLAAATSNGWPAMMTTWGLWNLVLIHGDTRFQLNWLYWTNLGLFNQNFGGLLVNSVFYTRILCAAILGGLSVSAKRTIFALRFGRKQVVQFKPRLKRILADVVLLDEIATLAEQAEKVLEPDREEMESNKWDMMMSPSIVQQNLNTLLWVPKIEYQNSNTSDADNESAAGSVSETPGNSKTDSLEKPTLLRRPSVNPILSKNAGRSKMKDMLDQWQEPDSHGDKDGAISIHEILKFRRALSHLEDVLVFGEAFGYTATREQCIANSQAVYYRLLKLAQDSYKSDGRIEAGVLPFDILALVCLGRDGTTEDLAKKRRIRKLFIPDKSGEMPLLAFIQSIDQCYKRMVFLRASLRNASLLDGVLEQIFNGIFYFLLFLFLSSILQLHPWTLMVSVTSILVSVSFALGPSVSGYVQGVLLIAIRRPFDLGDRIFMSAADSINPLPDVTKNSWFVEDITIATTTLRYARTNEVCTVNNSNIATTRIVNLARSPNAKVHFELAAHVSILDDGKLEQFRKEMERYVEERPRIWESVRSIRHEMPDADRKRVDITMSLRHRNAWQEAGRIKNDRADVFRFLYSLGKKLDIHFSAPVEQRVLYQGGVLMRGDNDDFTMRDILSGSNILPYGSRASATVEHS